MLGELGQLDNIQASHFDNLSSLGEKKKSDSQSSMIYGRIVPFNSEKAEYIGSIKEMETFVFKEIQAKGFNTFDEIMFPIRNIC